MYKIINVQKKENKYSKFLFETTTHPPEFFEYIDKQYKKTGKLLRYERIITEDKTECKTITVWKSRRDFLDYLTDPYTYEFLSNSNNYNIDNNISNFTIIEKEENE